LFTMLPLNSIIISIKWKKYNSRIHTIVRYKYRGDY
jgi:hypothetical protein